MTARRTIYVIEDGEYSGYNVLCAFESEADAQAVVADGLGDSYKEMVLFAAGERPTKRIAEWHAEARVPTSGEPDQPRVWARETWDSDSLEPHEQQKPAERPRVNALPGVAGRHISATGSDRESTLKACQDRYSQILAEREGL